jgi:hypothetical protein
MPARAGLRSGGLLSPDVVTRMTGECDSGGRGAGTVVPRTVTERRVGAAALLGPERRRKWLGDPESPELQGHGVVRWQPVRLADVALRHDAEVARQRCVTASHPYSGEVTEDVRWSAAIADQACLRVHRVTDRARPQATDRSLFDCQRVLVDVGARWARQPPWTTGRASGRTVSVGRGGSASGQLNEGAKSARSRGPLATCGPAARSRVSWCP